METTFGTRSINATEREKEKWRLAKRQEGRKQKMEKRKGRGQERGGKRVVS